MHPVLDPFLEYEETHSEYLNNQIFVFVSFMNEGKMDAEKKDHLVQHNRVFKCGWTRAPTCRVLTTSCILARPRSRKLSIRSPSINPVACSVLRSVWKDLQVPRSQGKSIQGCCAAWRSHFTHNITYFTLGTVNKYSVFWGGSLIKTALFRRAVSQSGSRTGL